MNALKRLTTIRHLSFAYMGSNNNTWGLASGPHSRCYKKDARCVSYDLYQLRLGRCWFQWQMAPTKKSLARPMFPVTERMIKESVVIKL